MHPRQFGFKTSQMSGVRCGFWCKRCEESLFKLKGVLVQICCPPTAQCRCFTPVSFSNNQHGALCRLDANRQSSGILQCACPTLRFPFALFSHTGLGSIPGCKRSRAFFVHDGWPRFVIIKLCHVLVLLEHHPRQDSPTHPCCVFQCLRWHVLRWRHKAW